MQFIIVTVTLSLSTTLRCFIPCLKHTALPQILPTAESQTAFSVHRTELTLLLLFEFCLAIHFIFSLVIASARAVFAELMFYRHLPACVTYILSVRAEN